MRTWVRLSDLKVSNLNAEGVWAIGSILDGPMYRSLSNGDIGYYDEYRSILTTFCPFQDQFVIRGDQYLNLVDSIRRGFQFLPDCPMVLSVDNQILDGQHRLSAVLHIHGADTVLRFVEERVVPIPGNRFVVSSDGQPARIVTGFEKWPALSLRRYVRQLRDRLEWERPEALARPVVGAAARGDR